MTNQQLHEHWLKHQKSSTLELSEFAYADQDMKNAIKQALVFWEFVRTFLLTEILEDQHKFLKHFITHSNPYIRIVAGICMLPVKVWRKILWRYNIDFQDFESCLRRIKDDQWDAIIENWQDLFKEKTPRTPHVYHERLWDRIKAALTPNFAQNLLKAPEDIQEDFKLRYTSKGAWAYSLLGLDFGFGKYPNGLLDDTEIKDRNISRFLSIKNHINDFVVNQEDGKYWALYRTARKNYGWGFWNNEAVKLKSHICPGFWATFFLHIMFWFISPLLFLKGFLPALESHSITYSQGVLMAIGCMTPIWLVISLLHFVLPFLGKSWMKPVYRVLGVGFLVLIALGITSLVYVGGIKLLEHSMIAAHRFWVVAITTMSIMTAIVLVFADQETSYYISDEALLGSKLISAAQIVILLCIACWDNITSGFHSLVNFLADHGFLLGAFAAMVLCLGIAIICVYHIAEDEQRYLKSSRRLMRIAIGAFIYVIIYCIFSAPEGTFSFDGLLNLKIIGFTVALLSPFLVYLFRGRTITEESVAYKEDMFKKAGTILGILKDKIEWSESNENNLLVQFNNANLQYSISQSLLMNSYLATMDMKRMRTLIGDMGKFLKEMTSNDDTKMKLIEAILLNISANNWQNLLKGKEKIKSYLYSQSSLLPVIVRYFMQYDYSQAAVKVEKVELKKKAINRKKAKWDAFLEAIGEKFVTFIDRVGDIAIVPFKYIGRFFKWCAQKIAMFVMDCYNLWKLFNERCPSVNQSKPLVDPVPE